MERAGLSRRLPAVILDGVYLAVITGIALVVYAIAGGTSLAVAVHDEFGLPLTWNTVRSDALWREFEVEAEAMIRDIETQVREDFTDEQAEFIARTMSDRMEAYLVPENISLDFILSLDARVLDRMVNEAFDAVIAAERADIPADKVNALRADVLVMMDRFAIGQLVPRAIRFALWLALLPALVALAYGFTEAVWGRTLGKLTVGLVVRRAGDDGPAVSNLMARYALKYSPLLLGIVALATRLPVFAGVAGGALVVVVLGSFAMVGPQKRALHDYIAGTACYVSEGRSFE